MSKKMTIPTIFSAVDKFSGPVNKMANANSKAMDRMQRKYQKVASSAFAVSRKSALIGTAIIAPMALLANEAVKFEKSMSNVATLIDTNTENIDKMGEEVLALSTKLPVPIEELTASLYDIRSAGIAAKDSMSTLEQAGKLSAAGLSSVEEATNITTSAINAFKNEGLSAEEITNILFKTVKAGKTTISELSQAFGSVAPIINSAGVKLSDFQAATAALTTTGTPAAQSQNQLRASIVALQKPSADMEKVFKKLKVTTGSELLANYDNMGDAFKAVNKATKELGLNNAKTWRSTEALAAVTSLTSTTNEAYIDTLGKMNDGTNQLEGAFKKQASTSASQMQMMKNNLKSLSIQLGQVLIPIISDLVKAITPVLKSFAKWAGNNKPLVATIMKIAAVLGGLSFAISAVSAVVGVGAKAMVLYTKVQKAMAVATKIVAAAQKVWNMAMAANPIGVLIVAVVALAAAVYVVARAFDTQSRSERLANEVRSRALDKTIDQRVEVMMLFKALRRAKVGTDEYSATLQKIEAIQPGVIEQYNLQAGALDDINRAEQALTKSIIARAEAEVRAELLREKIRESEIKKRDLKESGGGFLGALASVTTLGQGGTIGKQKEITSLQKDINRLANQVSKDQQAAAGKSTEDGKPLSTKKAIQARTEKTTSESKETVTIDFKNVPKGVEIDGADGGSWSIPNVGRTR